ncbi:hypothetical protein POVCU2_0031050 [Plasmodium ovale curtisi]|uniref:Uncharacterized protein n=1 Tax=Plasmodium ovale curtisi TaxID=864141 RepID=A0A1A8VXQ0_PLAOA|nr:hypothetical protein POVCU2_0031050 [Plasmodium ovale curtisi]SBS94485.1 hypothetical protein POVCU1_028450 [Plasmodium ovale curtisi]
MTFMLACLDYDTTASLRCTKKIELHSQCKVKANRAEHLAEFTYTLCTICCCGGGNIGQEQIADDIHQN